jgi:peptidoglycan LD-endopeptidase CwlK
MSFKLSKTSLERRRGVNDHLIEINDLALKISVIDFGIPEHGGLRSAETQAILFDQGQSRCDGYDAKSNHQLGLALDCYAYVDGKASWEPYHLALVAAAHLQAASTLGYQLSWGGLWHPTGPEIRQGVAAGWDMGHVELLD